MKNLQDKLINNQLRKNFFNLQKQRRNAIRRYTIFSNLSDRLAGITDYVSKGRDTFIGNNFIEQFETVESANNDVGQSNISANTRNLSSTQEGNLNLQNKIKTDLRNQLRNNEILKKNIYKNINLYEKDFITVVDDLDNNNKKIMNIDRLIQKNEYASTQKDKDIFILKSYFSALIFIIVIGLFYMTNIISGSKFLYTIIFIILFTTGFVLVNIYRSNRENKVKELSELSIKTAKKLEKEAVRFIAPLLKIDQCPTNKKCKKERLSEPIIINPNSVNVRAPEVYRDQPDNPFKDGIKSPISINANNCQPNDQNCINKIIPNNPVPGVSSAPIYTCKWNGNPEGMLNSNLGGNMNNMKYFRTYIPCQYYPGYSEATNKEKEDINKNGINLPFDN
jgi:hypothetical protein